tara:strand:- start:253 stop:684 length:432 start_codon:yes stop_codon:yes gene_type:complete
MLSSCGYQVVDKKKLQSFNILEINTIGEKRINFKLKNKLLSFKKESSKELITLDINSKKTKSVKEKNIKNQITKYQINLEIDVSYRKSNKTQISSFTVKQNGTYDVSSQHSQTLNNEKKLIDLLINDISEKIIDQLVVKFNEL